MRILQKRRPFKELAFSRDFDLIEDPQCGFTFPCDRNGNIEFASMSAKKNYEKAIKRPDLYEDKGIVRREITGVEPAVGLCSCGTEVILEDQYQGACQCPTCGRWYNTLGQALIDPEFWESEE